MRHPGFPHDHSLQYYLGLLMLDFPNRAGWGTFIRVWPHPKVADWKNIYDLHIRTHESVFFLLPTPHRTATHMSCHGTCHSIGSQMSHDVSSDQWKYDVSCVLCDKWDKIRVAVRVPQTKFNKMFLICYLLVCLVTWQAAFPWDILYCNFCLSRKKMADWKNIPENFWNAEDFWGTFQKCPKFSPFHLKSHSGCAFPRISIRSFHSTHSKFIFLKRVPQNPQS